MTIWNTEGIIESDPEEIIEVPEGHYLELGTGANLSNVTIRGKPLDERLQQFNDLFAQEYTSWDDVSREDLLYYLRVLLIEKEIPKHIAPFGDGLPACLLLPLSWLRSLFQALWQNAGEMCDPDNYLKE